MGGEGNQHQNGWSTHFGAGFLLTLLCLFDGSGHVKAKLLLGSKKIIILINLFTKLIHQQSV